MGIVSLFEVASMPVLQVVMIAILGALLATDYCNILQATARSSLIKIVFTVFTPCIMFASLAKTVTLKDLVSWWFMPVNMGLTFLIGGILGWILVKILKPKPYLEGLLIAACSSGNLGNLVLIIIPAVCKEKGSPFVDDHTACSNVGLSYASFSMALGDLYLWTYTYHLLKVSSRRLKALQASEEELSKSSNADLETHLLEGRELEEEEELGVLVESQETQDEAASNWAVKILRSLHHLLKELLPPPTLGAILGFIFGATTWLRNLIIGDEAPLRVIEDSVKLLGDGTIPCITLILGANLTRGLRSSRVRALEIMGVTLVRYVMLPAMGILVVRGAKKMGFLTADPLYEFVLMVQYTVPPAMTIGTVTQLLEVAQEECSVIMLWTYLVAALALTLWSALFMWILS